jgi:LacI family transcriptional regulator
MPTKGRVTIAQIAREARAAQSTVSCVLNGKLKESGASARRIAEIQAVARRLNYRPSAAARSMRTGRCDAIGLVLSTRPGRISPFLDLWLGLMDDLHARGMTLTVARLPDDELTSAETLPRLLSTWAVDGVLVDYVAEVPTRLLHLIHEHRIPAIWLNTDQPRDAVHPDDVDGARLATEHLLRLGHTRIAYHSGNAGPHYSHVDRVRGYEMAMRAAGLTPRVALADHWCTAAERLPAAHRLLAGPERPSAVLGYGPQDCLPLLLAALERGWRVPRDLSLATFHREPFATHGVDLTTAIIPAAAMGRAAVDLLLGKIADPSRSVPSQALPYTLHAGATCAPPP